MEESELVLVDATKNEPRWLLPGRSARALIKHKLMDPHSGHDGFPLGCVEGSRSRWILKTPRYIKMKAEMNKSKRELHQLVPDTKTLLIVSTNWMPRMRIPPRETSATDIIGTIACK